MSSTSITGKQVTLTYVEPGLWVGDVAIFDGERRTHDSYAHGETTLLCVSRVDLRKILTQHVELYEALPYDGSIIKDELVENKIHQLMQSA